MQAELKTTLYTEEQVREFALEFFFHWYNTSGSNTYQGFDAWWTKKKDELSIENQSKKK